MTELTPEEVEARKQAIYQGMSVRRRKRIERIGYENWDPFEEPKDPIDIRKDKSRRTSQDLVREFLANLPMDDYTNSYGRGVLEIAMGIVNNEDRFLGMYEFAVWYRDLLVQEGLSE